MLTLKKLNCLLETNSLEYYILKITRILSIQFRLSPSLIIALLGLLFLFNPCFPPFIWSLFLEKVGECHIWNPTIYLVSLFFQFVVFFTVVNFVFCNLLHLFIIPLTCFFLCLRNLKRLVRNTVRIVDL